MNSPHLTPHEHLKVLLVRSSSYREEGRSFMWKKDLVAARLCYNEALDYLVPNFESLKANLTTMGFDHYLSNKMKNLSKEIAMIFGNRSTVMLKERDVKIATLDAQQSLMYYPTAKGYFRLAEALSLAGYLKDALQNYSESYFHENNITTHCKYFMLAVDIGYSTVLLKSLSCYTAFIEKLITFPEFKVLHLEVLLLKCKALPDIQTGMAKNKCSTACIKELSKLMMHMKWKLVETLIEHGTIPDINCVDIAATQYGEDRAFCLIQCIEKVKNNKICYDNFLSVAIHKKWSDRFIHHCLERGAKFTAKDIWTVLQWADDATKRNLLISMVSQNRTMDVQNDKGQFPLDVLLEQGKFNSALALLELNLDTSGIDVIKTIQVLNKYDVKKYPIIKILDGIIKNKKSTPNHKQELNSALRHAFTNNHYDVALVLINHGADINSCVDKSTTVVHVATKIVLHLDEKTQILKEILDSCKLPENGKLVDKDRQLPHHLAVAANTSQSEAVLKLLFQYNFDLTAKNKNGETALKCCRRKRNHLRKLLEVEMAKHAVAVKSTGSNKADQKQGCTKVSTKDNASTTAATLKEVSEEFSKLPENENVDESDDETKLSVDELAELVNEKVKSILRKTDQTLREEPQETAKNIPSDTAIVEDVSRKEEQDRKKFEDCTWEIECTETFWKELSRQEKSLKEKAFQKLYRLANGEWHEKFHKSLSGTKNQNLYELKVNKSVRIIWERAVAYSPRLSLKDSSQNNPTELYTDVIRIWSLVLNHDRINAHVKQIETANIKGQESVIKTTLSFHSQTDHEISLRERIPCIYKIDPQCNISNNNTLFPPASAKENEYNVVTFYSVSDGFMESILKHEYSRRDFPFKGWPKENEIINLSMDNSVLLLGRSGTGKTTCCLYRLWNQFRLYWENANEPGILRISLIRPKPTNITSTEAIENEEINPYEDKTVLPLQQLQLNSSMEEDNSINACTASQNESEATLEEEPKLEFDDDMESWFESNSESNNDITSESEDEISEGNFKKHIIYDHLQQVFITKNNVLCAQFKKKFYDMAHTTKCLEGHLKFEQITYPNTLQKLDPHAFPLFLTTHRWLHLLDASLEDKPFFPRNPDGSLAVTIFDMDYNSDDFTENLVMLDESSSEDEEGNPDEDHTIKRRSSTPPSSSKLWKKVDATYFCEVLWKKVAKGICDSKKVSPLLVWIEIKSFIKGSSQALQTVNGFLSFQEYYNLGHKMAPNFVGNRETVYKLFERYEIVKKQMESRHFDDGELIFNLFQRLSKLDDINWCIHQFYIDEVQDFTQAELTLLLHCCRWPNGLFLTGDTAQSIMRGVSFRFSDLRSVFYYISQNVHSSRRKKAKLRVPQLHTLTQNFRSHSGILQLAASVIDLLMNFFQSSIDKLRRDQGMFPGPKPVLLLSCDFSDLAQLLKGNRREASAIEFGAKQAIIVQSEEVKKSLRDKIKAIVLTVFESKGLEFDDVLLYNFFSDSKATEEWQAAINYLDKNPDLVTNNEKMHKPRPLRQFDECEHKALNAELKYLYTAITRARCKLWIYDSNSDKRAPIFYYFQKRDLVTVSSLLDNDQEFGKISSAEEWKQQGDRFRTKKNWDMAMLCYKKAGMMELVRETRGDCNIWMAQKKNRKQNYLQAALNYLRGFDIQPSVKRIKKAATCLYNACKYDLAASLFLSIHEIDNAVKVFVKDGQYEKAANLCKQSNEIEKAIKILLLDREGKLLSNALQLALEYTNTAHEPFEIGCSVNEIAQRTAQFYLENGKIGKAIGCVEHFSKNKDKVSFFKKADLIDEAVDVLFTAKEYNDLYHLLKGKDKFDRGAEIAEKLHDDQVRCEFLLLSINKKLLCSDKWNRVIEANKLEEACKNLHHNDSTLTLQVELICGILREDSATCLNVYEKFNNINHFGAIEALNATICLNSDLKLREISNIVNCLQIAHDIIHEIKSYKKLSLKHSQQCRKFYQFEQSEDKFFLPPSQFYWVPTLENICLPEKDSDGMMQFDINRTYEILEQHIIGIAHKWLHLDLEKVLFNIISSKPYVSLNSVLDKNIGIQQFVKRCYEMSDYLSCCIKLIEISQFHYGNDIKHCSVGGNIDKWEKLKRYASSKILHMFSPQWNYLLKFSKNDIELIKKSKITCTCLLEALRPDDEVKRNINSLLYNWRILKMTGSDVSMVAKCLKDEEIKFNKEIEKDHINNAKKSSVSESEENTKTEKYEDISKDEEEISKEETQKSEERNYNESLEKHKVMASKDNNNMGKSLDGKEESKSPSEKVLRNEMKFPTNTDKFEQSSIQKVKVENDKEVLKDNSKENISKPNIHERQSEVPTVLIKTESGYSHSFRFWLESCVFLENSNFMGFAECIIKRLFTLFAKRKSLKPKITVMNMTSMLEVICTGLFASLKVANMRASKVLLPKFYVHHLSSYDPINFTPHAFLDLVPTSVAKSEDLKQLCNSSVYLLQKILQLLLGTIEPSFNVLHHAALTSVDNDGFKRCLVLCLSLFGNLWPLTHEREQGNILQLIWSMKKVLHVQTETIKNSLPELFSNFQGIFAIQSTKDIFNILFNIQKRNQSNIVNLQYHIKTKAFSFDEIEPRQFPTSAFKPSRYASTSFPQNIKQWQQLQHTKKPNANTPMPKPYQQRPLNYKAAVEQSKAEQSNNFSQLSELSYTSQHVATESHQEHEISNSENNTVTMNIGSPTETSHDKLHKTYSQALQECTVPIHSSANIIPSIIADDHQDPPEVNNSCSQSYLERKLVEDPQHIPDTSIETSLQKKTNLSQCSQSLTNLEISEISVHQAVQDQICLPRPLDDTSSSTNGKPLPISVSTSTTHSLGLQNSTIAAATGTIVLSTSVTHHQLAHAKSQSNVTPSTEPLQSTLKPDAESFEPTNDFNFFKYPPPSSDVNIAQVQESALQNEYQPTENYSYEPDSDYTQLVQQPSYPTDFILHPQTALQYHPLMGQHMHMPMFGMVTVDPTMWYMYSQPMDQPLYANMPHTPTDDKPISPHTDQLDMELEDLQFSSLTNTKNMEASGNEKRSDNLPIYCAACDYTAEDDESKINHYTSPEHLNNNEQYSAYQETVQKYAENIDDTKVIIESAVRSTGIGHNDKLIQTQIDKIREWKGKYDREKCQIEDKHDWSNGQKFMERCASELKELKEYYEKLQSSVSLV